MFKNKKLAIFDLDGTVANTIADLSNSMDYAMEQCNCPKHSQKEYLAMVGSGTLMFVKGALPDDKQELAQQALGYLRSHYRENYCVETVAYDGIIEILGKLKNSGMQLMILTNKDEGIARTTVSKIFGDDLFGYVAGARDDVPLKPDPQSLLSLIEKGGCDISETVFVGDSDVDIMTGKNAVVDTVAVSWGFRAKEQLAELGCDIMIDEPKELLKLL